MKALDPTWQVALEGELRAPYFQDLLRFVKQERSEHVVYPPPNQVFTAFRSTPLDKVRVVILGQDPYHGEGQAHGLSFSVLPGTPLPPSLKNIYQELRVDLGVPTPKHGCLQHWADQGVFLLNSVLTVRAQAPGSHQKKGWETFTDRVVEVLAERTDPLVFILWGRYAREKAKIVDCNRHLILESPHPSPLSAYSGFFGSRPFSKTNEGLEFMGLAPIDWVIPET